jgi:tetratricopeptide (TPR) repeat protein
MRGGARVVLVAACVLLAGRAHAEDKAKAREAFESATRHYDLTEYREALAAFKEAYRNYPDPSFLFNIGQCHRQLGDKEQAIKFFHNYLSKVPDAPNRDAVRSMIAHLEQLSEEERRNKASPPVGTMPPNDATSTTTPSTTTAAPLTVTATSEPPPARTPIYKKWWLWTAVGVAAAGVAVGLGVGLSGSSSQTATTSFGTLHPF